ncbi:MAG: 50S ribosomal protein L18 [Caulobacterales bacterium]|jgi:large subunit ribosomal protein L18
MKSALEKNQRRALRQRSKLRKVSIGRLRLSVFRSSKNISAQVIDDVAGVTVVAASTLEKVFKDAGKPGSDKDAAVAIGKLIAERAASKGVKQVVFDRGAYLFHGRVKALADAAREGGLDF